jgi:hypothetical protein
MGPLTGHSHVPLFPYIILPMLGLLFYPEDGDSLCICNDSYLPE